MAGLIKTVLVLVHEQAPANAALKSLNPYIEEIISSKKAPIHFTTKLEPLRSLSSVKSND